MEKQVKISSKLQKAREYEKCALKKGTAAPKQDFHACVPVGWMNDPNGFSEYNGEKHLFFQYHPYNTAWGPMHWGHMKTTDFIHWENMPVALAPDKKYDGFGCFSGGAIEWKGRHVLAYTGVERRKEEDGQCKDYQMQCIAVGDGVNYEKIKENPVITGDKIPEGDSAFDFRDPKIWVDGDIIYMVVGNRSKDGSGQILLYKTLDLKNWEFVTVLDKCNNRYGKMWECPDFFRLEGEDILIVSPQEMEARELEFHAGDGTIYILGSFEKEKAVFTEKVIRALDMGLDFYAPQTMLTSDGRRIMIAWLQAWCASWFDERDGFCGMMTLPRELHIKNGILCQNPVRELESYYQNKVELKEFVPGETYQKYDELSGRVQNLDITLDGEESYQFEIQLAADDVHYTAIKYDKKEQMLTFDRSNSGVRRDAAHVRSMRILSNDRIVKLRIVMDRYSIELFVNGGEQAMTSVIRTPIKSNGVCMRTQGNVKVSVIKHDICLL